MTKVKWAISTEIFEKPGFPKITDALERSGLEYFNSKFDHETCEYEDVPFDPSKDCVVVYGPIKFARTKDRGFLPGSYSFNDNVNTRQYMSNLPKELFFNSDAIYLPFGQIVSSKALLSKLFGDRIFIRPDSGYKSFTGFDVSIDDIEDEISARKQTEHVLPDEFCIIAKGKPILAEYRMVICENQVITGSQYRWDGKMGVRIDVHHGCWDFAQTIAQHKKWQPDTCYTLDIFLGESGPLIGEINSFSCSGLYNCDMDKIVQAVSKTAIKEWIQNLI